MILRIMEVIDYEVQVMMNTNACDVIYLNFIYIYFFDKYFANFAKFIDFIINSIHLINLMDLLHKT